MNINHNELAMRCLDAAADLDDDELASPTELAAIATTIARRIAPDEPMMIDFIASLTNTDPAAIIDLLDHRD